jgi:hypothetical protein
MSDLLDSHAFTMLLCLVEFSIVVGIILTQINLGQNCHDIGINHSDINLGKHFLILNAVLLNLHGS